MGEITNMKNLTAQWIYYTSTGNCTGTIKATHHYAHSSKLRLIIGTETETKNIGKTIHDNRVDSIHINKILADIPFSPVNQNTNIGQFFSEKYRDVFVLQNTVASKDKQWNNIKSIIKMAHEETYKYQLTLNQLLKDLWAEILSHKQNYDIDLEPENLNKNTLINLFN